MDSMDDASARSGATHPAAPLHPSSEEVAGAQQSADGVRADRLRLGRYLNEIGDRAGALLGLTDAQLYPHEAEIAVIGDLRGGSIALAVALTQIRLQRPHVRTVVLLGASGLDRSVGCPFGRAINAMAQRYQHRILVVASPRDNWSATIGAQRSKLGLGVVVPLGSSATLLTPGTFLHIGKRSFAAKGPNGPSLQSGDDQRHDRLCNNGSVDVLLTTERSRRPLPQRLRSDPIALAHSRVTAGIGVEDIAIRSALRPRLIVSAGSGFRDDSGPRSYPRLITLASRSGRGALGFLGLDHLSWQRARF
jgi:hypothetical protein